MKYLNKMFTAVRENEEYTGVCLSSRTISHGPQLFLKASGKSGRYFFVDEIMVEQKKVEPKNEIKFKPKKIKGSED